MYRLRCQEQGTVTPETTVTPPTQPPEVPIDEPQQPFSFGDFTRPSDFQGTIYWPQQWDHQSPGSQVSLFFLFLEIKSPEILNITVILLPSNTLKV